MLLLLLVWNKNWAYSHQHEHDDGEMYKRLCWTFRKSQQTRSSVSDNKRKFKNKN